MILKLRRFRMWYEVPTWGFIIFMAPAILCVIISWILIHAPISGYFIMAAFALFILGVFIKAVIETITYEWWKYVGENDWYQQIKERDRLKQEAFFKKEGKAQ